MMAGFAVLAIMLQAVAAQAYVYITLGTTITDVSIVPKPFYTQVPNANIQPVQTITYTLTTENAGDTLTVSEAIINAQDEVVNQFGVNGQSFKATGTYTLATWNGKYNVGANSGNYVPDGMYRFRVTTSDGKTYVSDAYGVYATVVPALSLVNTPSTLYYSGGGAAFDVNYNLKKNSSSTVNVKLKIVGPTTNPSTREISDVKAADGNYLISWDGKMNGQNAAAGTYTWTLSGVGVVKNAQDYNVDSNVLSGSLTVSAYQQPNPTLTELSVSPNPYDPADGNATLTYKLNGSYGFTTVEAAIYSVNDYNNALKSWSFGNQASGPVSMSWDGRNSNNTILANGSYAFKVWGTDGSFTMVPQQTSFTITAAGQTGNNCAGFIDVDEASTDCDAISYVKSIGAMTGNPNGTFDPSGILQRDQIAKISLETFNLFNSSSDYCSNENPFPDLTKSEWSYQYICRGKDLGMITGYKSGADAGYYRPARSVNRVEFLALILRNLNETMPGIISVSYSDVASGQWYSGYAKYSYDHSLFTGSKLYPTNFVTRVEVARVLYKLHEQGKI